MKAMLPLFCRPLGYVILLVSLFLPFMMVMQGAITDSNLLFYKECIKLLRMVGALMISAGTPAFGLVASAVSDGAGTGDSC